MDVCGRDQKLLKREQLRNWSCLFFLAFRDFNAIPELLKRIQSCVHGWSTAAQCVRKFNGRYRFSLQDFHQFLKLGFQWFPRIIRNSIGFPSCAAMQIPSAIPLEIPRSI